MLVTNELCAYHARDTRGPRRLCKDSVLLAADETTKCTTPRASFYPGNHLRGMRGESWKQGGCTNRHVITFATPLSRDGVREGENGGKGKERDWKEGEERAKGREGKGGWQKGGVPPNKNLPLDH